ncbi:MAG: polysaccharide deacetylase family protein, partial [Bacteroidota bacterium]
KENYFEAGLHASFYSYDDPQRLHRQVSLWKRHLGFHPKGIRQHYLRYRLPETSSIQASEGFLYDTTLGFADHDGYRNGYCYPFLPYDHDRDEMIPLWEIPLIMMDMSVLDYRNFSNNQLQILVFKYIEEAKKFGGIFSLLWHNCRLNNKENPGITVFYKTLLKQIVKENPISMRGTDLVTRIKKFHKEDSE